MANDYKFAEVSNNAREKALRYAKIEYNFYEQAKNEGYEKVNIESVMHDLKNIIVILQEVGKKADRWIPTKLIPNEGADSCDNEYVIEADREHALVFVSVHGNIKLDKVIEEDGGYSFEKYMPESVQAWMPIEIPEPYRKD